MAKPYIFEPKIKECLIAAGVSEAKDDSIRLQGVAWIDSVRKAMHLPVRTYNTAAVYYHKLRLVHPDSNGYIDAAAAALFAACKIEDTLKKSKEILCAAYNLKLTPAEQLSPDDQLFENHSKTIIGLERLMLEASGFDFRNRYPQNLVLKMAKHYHVDRDTVGKTAYNISLDLYRTFAPLKQTTATMAIACVELSGRICEQPIAELEAGKNYKRWRISRPEVMETLLDLLDLYTHHRASTIVGQDHALETFISIRIALNQEASANKYPRHFQSHKKKYITNGAKAANGIVDSKAKNPITPITSPRDESLRDTTSPTANGGPKPGLKEGTVRFILNPQRARDEKNAVAEFFKVEEEEYEVVVERERRRVLPETERPRPLKAENKTTMATSSDRDPRGRSGNALEKQPEGQRKDKGQLGRQGLIREGLPAMKDEVSGRASKRRKRRRGR
ncbi:MAG: RNA polymerase II C-terminal domain kinase beta subunit [Alectoria sarmentosa]|nr:MAG: RNA polymerase II C-terminal domain kinase beta subunit [Alectoria sarmentosa]